MGDNGRERARIDRVLEVFAKMQRINRIGKRTTICMLIIAAIAIAYGLLR